MSDQCLLCSKDIGHAVRKASCSCMQTTKVQMSQCNLCIDCTVTKLDASIFSRIWPVYVAEQAD